METRQIAVAKITYEQQQIIAEFPWTPTWQVPVCVFRRYIQVFLLNMSYIHKLNNTNLNINLKEGPVRS